MAPFRASPVDGAGNAGARNVVKPVAVLSRSLTTLVVVVLLAGCVHYPTVDEAGNARIRPVNGRMVREADGARFYVELHSTGKFGDVLTAAQVPGAREARLVATGGASLERVDVPGTAVVALSPGGPHVRVGGLARPLVAGEVLIVTLVFEKTGHLGVVTVVE